MGRKWKMTKDEILRMKQDFDASYQALEMSFATNYKISIATLKKYLSMKPRKQQANRIVANASGLPQNPQTTVFDSDIPETQGIEPQKDLRPLQEVVESNGPIRV